MNASHKFVDVEGMRTHYLEAGSGPNLVLLHSGEFGASAEFSWERNIDDLAKHFHVVAPDWLGFGQTAKIFSFDDMIALRIRHIAQFLNTIGIGAAHFIGNSMGGGVLATVAGQDDPAWPIQKMILTGAGGFAPKNAARETLNTYEGSLDHMRRIVQTLFINPAVKNDEAYIARRHQASLEPGAWEAVAAARFKRPGAEGKPREEIRYGNIKVPTLVLCGAHDPLREPGFGASLQKQIPGSRLIVFENGGHCPQIDDPERFNREAIAFLSA
jgi:pimeloyl-ACP methyl ester carboxylesterase